MSNLDAMRIVARRAERAAGPRRLPHAMRVVLLALHQSRRRMAKRILRESGHLRDASGRAAAGWPDTK